MCCGKVYYDWAEQCRVCTKHCYPREHPFFPYPLDLGATRQEIPPTFSAPSPADVARGAAESAQFPAGAMELAEFAADGEVALHIQSVEEIAAMPSTQSPALGPGWPRQTPDRPRGGSLRLRVATARLFSSAEC